MLWSEIVGVWCCVEAWGWHGVASCSFLQAATAAVRLYSWMEWINMAWVLVVQLGVFHSLRGGS